VTGVAYVVNTLYLGCAVLPRICAACRGVRASSAVPVERRRVQGLSRVQDHTGEFLGAQLGRLARRLDGC
jgi:hypothetical protein